ncbi:MAG: DUF4981 domain-containing protein [Clostridia bacterium]|nr:DUF4981 domain-containing protein [Clostridia bacterium]
MSFAYERLRDPAYFQENRLPAHSDHQIYATRSEWEANDSSLRFSLNGLWKFHHALNEKQVISGFEALEYDCRPWTEIHVPAHIQMEGYGVPQYANKQYPWDGSEDIKPGQTPENFNPVACYVKYFRLPESMKEKRVFISFQGAESCVVVWLNGHYVGFSSDSFSPSEFELTPYLCEGENKLACRVYRFCSGSWLEDQDFFRFSGLFREVFLYAAPAVHLEDLKLQPELDDEYCSANLSIGMKLMTTAKWQAKIALLDADDHPVWQTEQFGDGDTLELQPRIITPEKWSAENPYLYTLEIELLDADGHVQEYMRERVGFRRFEMKNGLMMLNGKRIVFKGVNRHDFCPETGRVVPEEKIRRDLLTMKRNNINAVRTSHYPNPSCLYRMADELGLYVMDETNMETHYFYEAVHFGKLPLSAALPGDDEAWQPLLFDRVKSMVERDKNHVCILMWSCGNESYGGKVILAMSHYLRQLDPSRLVHYEGVAMDPRYPETTDMYSFMYAPVKQLREHMKEHRDKPTLLCEYSHAMGNSCGALHKYTEYAYEEPLYQGGFICDFIDQSIRVKNRFGQDVYRYGGDLDDHPHDGNFSGDGIVYGDGNESPKMQEVKYCYQDLFANVTAEGVTITNRSLFTPSDVYLCEAILRRDGEIISRKPMSVSVPPQSESWYPLPFEKQTIPGEYAAEVVFRLRKDRPWAEMGCEVAFGQGVWKVEGDHAPEIHPPLKVVEGLYNIGVTGENFRVLFSYFNGGLESYRFGGKEMLKTVPMPSFWRAPTDNDRGNFMPARYGQWKLASLYATPRYPQKAAQQNEPPFWTRNEDDSITVRYLYTLPTTPQAECTLSYTVHPCGTVTVELDYTPVEGLSSMPEFGVMLRMSADYDQLRFYGEGPEETYADRRHGGRLGIWQSRVKDLPAYLKPQECGNHTGVRWAEVTDFRGRGLRFTGDEMFFSALPYTPHELENALHADELPPVHYTVVRASLMQMGVGGDDSWGAMTHDEYLIDTSKPLHFRFCFRGI